MNDRRKQIEEAAKERFWGYPNAERDQRFFIEAAEWADANPKQSKLGWMGLDQGEYENYEDLPDPEKSTNEQDAEAFANAWWGKTDSSTTTREYLTIKNAFLAGRSGMISEIEHLRRIEKIVIDMRVEVDQAYDAGYVAGMVPAAEVERVNKEFEDYCREAETHKDRAVAEAVKAKDSDIKRLRDITDSQLEKIQRVENQLRESAESVCSLLCPSAWQGERPPHNGLCQRITTILNPPKTEKS